jgi:hypothetical protein
MTMTDSSRREFLTTAAAGGAAAWGLAAQEKGRILIQAAERESFLTGLARKELLRGLVRLNLPFEARFAGREEKPLAADRLCVLRVDRALAPNPEAYSISASGRTLLFTAAGERALLYAVFDFLERQGAYFGIDGESYPLDPTRDLTVPAQTPWTASPRFAVRGLLPWPDFLNCITVYNSEDFRAYFESMLRMRFNTFGMHAYSSPNDVESYLPFEFAGVGHTAYLDNTASGRWGYLPQRTSRYTMGGSEFYDGEVFGSDATRLGRNPWEIAERTQKLLRDALAYAGQLGIRTGVGFEPYQLPDEILRALPPEAKPRGARADTGPRFDIESVTAKKLLETRLAALLETCPSVDYVWLWEDENMNWQSRNTGVPLSVTPFLQAHDFLRRHAPRKRLVLSGWGGMARNFAYFHQKMPGDVIFSCLGDSLGWDPTHEAFGALEGRERWPIPWIEDDPAMWLPQFHAHRFERDLNLAEQYGCQGILGIHWRHRIVDATAGFQARFSWDKALTPATHFRNYARTQAAGPRVERLAAILTGVDKDQPILSTGGDQVKDGHVVTSEYSGDYGEGFQYWNKSTPSPELLAAQKKVAAALAALVEGGQSAAERERLAYLSRHVEFLVPYADAWVLAQELQKVLNAAQELRAAGKKDEAGEKVRAEGVPLWLKLAPDVRAAMLLYQGIVATRNDLGQLASMHNKFVRLALYRFRLSLQEYLGELPPETEKLFAEVTRPDPKAPVRLIAPTRPGMLRKGEKVHIMLVAAGSGAVSEVTLHTRLYGAGEWKAAPARLMGRRTYEVTLGPFDAAAPLAEYYASARVGNRAVTAPPDAPAGSYFVTVSVPE